jgi:hypothetical protein
MRSSGAWIVAFIGALLIAAVPNGVAAQPQGERVVGTVEGVAGNTVTLTDGSSFSITDATRVAVAHSITAADLEPGQFVAITATLEPDDVLLASIVSVFPASSTVAARQFPMDAVNLMTNANIDEATIDMVSGVELSVSFEGGTSRVRIPPEAEVILRTDGTAADIQPGSRIVATLSSTEATSVTVFEDV